MLELAPHSMLGMCDSTTLETMTRSIFSEILHADQMHLHLRLKGAIYIIINIIITILIMRTDLTFWYILFVYAK